MIVQTRIAEGVVEVDLGTVEPDGLVPAAVWFDGIKDEAGRAVQVAEGYAVQQRQGHIEIVCDGSGDWVGAELTDSAGVLNDLGQRVFNAAEKAVKRHLDGEPPEVVDGPEEPEESREARLERAVRLVLALDDRPWTGGDEVVSLAPKTRQQLEAALQG